MKCESVHEQLIGLWNETLEPDARAEVETHLTGCPDCRRQSSELRALWANLGSLDNERAPEPPSQAMRERFYSWLATQPGDEVADASSSEVKGGSEAQGGRKALPYVRGWLAALLPSGGTLRPAWSLPTLVLGVALGASLMWAWNANQQIQRLTDQVDSMNRSASLSLLDHPSASERLRGVSWGSRALADDRIVEALLASVRHDPNVNVRLAALETLALQIDSPRVHAGLLETLPRQESPMLQVALVEILKQKNGGTATSAIEELLQREDLDDDARTRIQTLLQDV